MMIFDFIHKHVLAEMSTYFSANARKTSTESQFAFFVTFALKNKAVSATTYL